MNDDKEGKRVEVWSSSIKSRYCHKSSWSSLNRKSLAIRMRRVGTVGKVGRVGVVEVGAVLRIRAVGYVGAMNKLTDIQRLYRL